MDSYNQRIGEITAQNRQGGNVVLPVYQTVSRYVLFGKEYWQPELKFATTADDKAVIYYPKKNTCEVIETGEVLEVLTVISVSVIEMKG